jgi:RNA polymerase sigma factor (sigma-70 family)
MNDQTERALDGYLIALIRGGSREAFDRLVRRWTPKLVRYATRVLGRPDAARDVVQETWIGVIRGLKQLHDTAQFPAWIYSIAHRKCVDGIRFAQRQRRLVSSVEQESAGDAADNQRRAELVGAPDIAAAVAQLSEEHREVVHLFYTEDLTIIDIASILSVPVGTVKSRLHHARESLKNLLGE